MKLVLLLCLFGLTVINASGSSSSEGTNTVFEYPTITFGGCNRNTDC